MSLCTSSWSSFCVIGDYCVCVRGGGGEEGESFEVYMHQTSLRLLST